MTKFGILTYQQAVNYGAILQAYALQETINKIGGEAYIIDYRNKRLNEIHSKKSIKDIRGIKDIVKYILIYRYSNKKYEKFEDFKVKYLKLTSSVNTGEEILSLNLDAYITGSDQVWNIELNENDWTYFLDFAHKEKSYSYAASIGLNYIDEKYIDKYKKLIENFSIVTVRESTAKKLLNEIGIEKEVETVLDPTLLLKKEEWASKLTIDMAEEKYLLVYAFSGSKNIYQKALEIANKRQLKIKWISNTPKKDKNIEYIRNAGPEEFVNYFLNASFVLTNSFHGTVFSINFEKEFIVELLQKNTKVNSRMENILESLDLSERIMYDETFNLRQEIDYFNVNRKLNILRKSSLEALTAIVKDEK